MCLYSAVCNCSVMELWGLSRMSIEFERWTEIAKYSSKDIESFKSKSICFLDGFFFPS